MVAHTDGFYRVLKDTHSANDSLSITPYQQRMFNYP
jgi:hypothetical protein